MAFKKSHNDRSCNIVGKVGNDLDRSAVVSFSGKSGNVHLQDIFVDNSDIIIGRKGVCKNGDQCPVNFYRYHFPGTFSQILGHGSDAGTDLKYKIIPGDPCGGNDLIQDISIDQKVLPEAFLEVKVIFFQYFQRSCRISESWHMGILLTLLCQRAFWHSALWLL